MIASLETPRGYAFVEDWPPKRPTTTRCPSPDLERETGGVLLVVSACSYIAKDEFAPLSDRLRVEASLGGEGRPTYILIRKRSGCTPKPS